MDCGQMDYVGKWTMSVNGLCGYMDNVGKWKKRKKESWRQTL